MNPGWLPCSRGVGLLDPRSSRFRARCDSHGGGVDRGLAGSTPDLDGLRMFKKGEGFFQPGVWGVHGMWSRVWLLDNQTNKTSHTKRRAWWFTPGIVSGLLLSRVSRGSSNIPIKSCDFH